LLQWADAMLAVSVDHHRRPAAGAAADLISAA
jgi:hypothetical protein